MKDFAKPERFNGTGSENTVAVPVGKSGKLILSFFKIAEFKIRAVYALLPALPAALHRFDRHHIGRGYPGFYTAFQGTEVVVGFYFKDHMRRAILKGAAKTVPDQGGVHGKSIAAVAGQRLQRFQCHPVRGVGTQMIADRIPAL